MGQRNKEERKKISTTLIMKMTQKKNLSLLEYDRGRVCEKEQRKNDKEERERE